MSAAALPRVEAEASKDGGSRYLSLLPALPPGLVVLAFFVLPVLIMASTSLRPNEDGLIGDGITLDNYRELVADSYYMVTLGRTLALSATVGVIVTLLALPIAYFLTRTTSRFRSLFIVLSIAPELAGVVLRTYGWLVILDRNGAINQLLLATGLIDRPLALTPSFLGVVVGMTHVLLPFGILSLFTVFQGLDPNLERAAAVLGAGKLSIIGRIILPMVLPGLLGAFFLAFTLTASAYATPALLGGVAFPVIATELYQQLLYYLNWPMAAVLANVLFVIVLLIAFSGSKIESRVRERLHA